jgi:hypothetical protein
MSQHLILGRERPASRGKGWRIKGDGDRPQTRQDRRALLVFTHLCRRGKRQNEEGEREEPPDAPRAAVWRGLSPAHPAHEWIETDYLIRSRMLT